MFEKLLKAIKQIEGTHTYSTTIKPDEEGFIDKECPNEKCSSKFKVKAKDWSEKFSDDKVYCPYCGFQAQAKSWYTTEQIEEAKEQAINSVKSVLGEAMKKDAKSFNSRQKQGYITMSMRVTGCQHYSFFPIKALDLMEQKLTCSSCGSTYAVIGASTFCPCCGYNSPKSTFTNIINTIKAKLQMIAFIDLKADCMKLDEKKMVKQSLLDSSFSELVSAFQVLCLSIFKNNFPNIIPKSNVFQRIDDGNKLWNDNLGIGYDKWLTPCELSQLKLCFQQRHIIEHNNGIVDENYVKKSGDRAYSVSQHLIIKENDVRQFLSVIEKVGNCIISSAQE